MTKKFLAIIPENSAPPALIGEALLEAGHSYDAIYPMDRFASHSPLSYTGLPSEPGDYAGLIMMGGPMSANDTADHAFLQESMAFIPASALAEGDGNTGFVYTLNADKHTVKRIPVHIAYLQGDRIAISTGLDTVGSVIADGVGYLTEKSVVKLISNPDSSNH